jgi:tetrahydrodipicolinate N-succinyltransferase
VINLYCAVIVKRKVDAKTRAKTSINEICCATEG